EQKTLSVPASVATKTVCRLFADNGPRHTGSASAESRGAVSRALRRITKIRRRQRKMLKVKGLAVFTFVLLVMILVAWRVMSAQQQRHADIGENVAAVTSGNGAALTQNTVDEKRAAAADNGFADYLAAAGSLGA